MAGLQSVIDNTTFLTINKRKSAGSTVSRSGHIKTSVQQGTVYRFTVGAPQGLTYTENKVLLQELDNLDVTVEQQISFGNTNSALTYITEYQGGITNPNLSSITTIGSQGANLYVDCSAITAGSGNMFVTGDFIQPQGNTMTYRYPYQVTANVTYQSGANVTIPVNRPVLSQSGVSLASGNIRIGRNCNWTMICVNMPTYSVVPHNLLEFSNDFELVEVII